MNKMRKCPECGSYTLKDICPNCTKPEKDQKTESAHPASFSPEDPYGKYRRKLKIEELELDLEPGKVE